MKITEPKLENREALPYVGIRSQVSMQEMPNIIPQHIGEVAGWLGQQGIEPDGPPIIRYHVCPTVAAGTALVDMTVGWPVVKPLTGNGHIVADALPTGRYASLVYTGVENGVPANAVLIDWAKENGVEWNSRDVELGEAFAGRVEHLLDGPDDDPNPSNWKTEVAILTA
jgi:effector-binding domain-containing protein